MCTATVVEQVHRGLTRREAMRAGAAALAGAALAGCARHQRGEAAGQLRRIVDLTHTLTPDFPMYPAPMYSGIEIERVATIGQHGFFANRWTLIEHCGTHVDAPAHFAPWGATLESVAADSLICPAAVIDISVRAAFDPDSTLRPDDIILWEGRHGRLPRGAAVLVRSGWDAKVSDPAAFLGTDASGTLHFPGISPEAAAMLASEREIAAVGVDTLSLDFGPSTDFAAHHALLGEGILGIECVANLGTLPRSGATVFIGALKVAGASGGPCRLIAQW
jgi:kynurenine formamidase